MPYKSNEELPKGVRNNLPTQAQTIYKKTFNSADEKYPEKMAHQTAWTAVKKSYEKKGDKWIKK